MLTNEELFRAIETECGSHKTDSTQEMDMISDSFSSELDFLFDDAIFDSTNPEDHTIDLSDIPFDDLFVGEQEQESCSKNNSPTIFESSHSSNTNDNIETDMDDLEFIQPYQPPSVTVIKKTIRPYRRLKPRKTMTVQVPSSNLNNEDLDHGQPGQRLYLSDEEKYLLSQQNMKIPTKLPLTRQEDRVLRAVRRRIRNKLSAKASRAKKQEQVCELEKRTQYYEEENKKLRKQVSELNQNNRGLVSLVRRLQDKLSYFSPRTKKDQFGLSSDSIIGKHKLTSIDHAQRAVLPRYENDLLPGKYKADHNGTYLLMFVVFFAIAIFPMSMSTSIWQFGRMSAPAFSGEAQTGATGRMLLSYGPQTLEQYKKSHGQQETTIEIVASPPPDRKKPDKNATFTSRKQLDSSTPVIIAA